MRSVTAPHRPAGSRGRCSPEELNPTALDELCGSLLADTPQFSEQALGRIAWSLAALVVLHRPLLAAIASASIPKISHFSPLYLVDPAWSLSRLSFSNAPLMHAISAAARRRLSDFRRSDLSSSAWACSTLR